MTLTLAQAFIAQAREDMRTFDLVWGSKLARSQGLHLLQMTIEKTGKAYLAAAGKSMDDLAKSHLAFGKFLRHLARTCPPNLAATYIHNRAQLSAHINAIAPIADSVERLVPGRLNGGPNAEYPWCDPNGDIHTPCQHTFARILQQIDSSQGRAMLKLLTHAIDDPDFHSAFGI